MLDLQHFCLESLEASLQFGYSFFWESHREDTYSRMDCLGWPSMGRCHQTLSSHPLTSNDGFVQFHAQPRAGGRCDETFLEAQRLDKDFAMQVVGV